MAVSLLVVTTGAGCLSPSAPPKPPAGGQRLVLDFPTYRDSVAPVISAHGCDADGDCHGGGIRGTLQLSPAGAKNLTYDFNQVVLQVYPTQRDSSPILLRPLANAAGGRPHPYKAFATTDDPQFRTLRAWVQAGVLQ
jgi:hypothetical protein